MRYLLSPPSCGDGTLEICPFKILNLYTSLSRLTIQGIAPLRIIFVIKWNERGKKCCEYEFMSIWISNAFLILKVKQNMKSFWLTKSPLAFEVGYPNFVGGRNHFGKSRGLKKWPGGQISWKLLSLFFYRKMVIPFLDDDKGAYLKIWWLPHQTKKNRWLDFIVKSKCVWILIGMIRRKPGFILISIHPFLEAVHGHSMDGRTCNFRQMAEKQTVPYS